MGSAAGMPGGASGKGPMGQLGQLANPQTKDPMQNQNNQGLPGMQKPQQQPGPPVMQTANGPVLKPMPAGGPQPMGQAKPGAGYNPLADASLTTPGAIAAQNRGLDMKPPSAGGPLAQFQAQPGRMSGLMQSLQGAMGASGGQPGSISLGDKMMRPQLPQQGGGRIPMAPPPSMPPGAPGAPTPPGAPKPPGGNPAGPATGAGK